MTHPVSCINSDQEELVAKIAEAFGDDWWQNEGFETWQWVQDPDNPGHRPMLQVDGEMVFSTFNDGVLGCTTPGPLGSLDVRAFRGHDEQGNMIWERGRQTLGDPGQN